MAFLTYKEILELIDKVAKSGIRSIEIESSGTRVRIEGAVADAATSPQFPHRHVEAEGHGAGEAAAQQAGRESAGSSGEDGSDPTWHIVTSPIVGTFYAAPNPEAEPFVRVGDRVSKGSVICIIEAMKLMNEIESDADGEIVRVFPKNAQPIEYGDRLFALKP